MPEKKSAAKKPAKSAAGKFKGLTSDERAAMKERVKELKAESRGGKDGESDVLAVIDKMPEPDRSMGKRLHAVITSSGPDLKPKTWYGMPAYAKDGKVIVFFRGASKFKERYAMLGFNDGAKLDEGSMWPTAFALTKLTAADEKRIGALVKRALS
jgi:uncharacterized protein YdhG (YjbR/CyaY superfamily)